MEAFHGSVEIKQKYLARVRYHREADNLIQGVAWEDGKGCAVGCTLEAYEHKRYETELGIPEWLARVEDILFEGLPNDVAMLWPERFLTAITPGADLEQIKAPFLIYVLESTLNKFDHVAFPDCKAAVERAIAYYRSGSMDINEAMSAAEAARSAAWAARSAAEAAARSAAWAARSAARSAAEAAARSAARSAAEAAEAAEAAAGAAAWAAEAYEKFADKLIELLEGLGEVRK